ncbi:hypothetical protein AB9C48_23315, partial [Escherichia coli]
WFPVHFRFLAHSLTTFGRWGCGERWDHSHMMQILFFFALELSVVAVLMGSCDMLDGGRSEGTATTHPSQ